MVLTVEPHGAADKAGLRPGDRLQSISGFAEVKTAGDAQYIIAAMFNGNKNLIIKLADGRKLRLPAVTAPRRSHPVHPTQIYSTINALLICLFLLTYDPFRRRDGELWAWMMTIYPLARFLEEMIRNDEASILRHGHDHIAERKFADSGLCNRDVDLRVASAARFGVSEDVNCHWG